MFGFKNKFDHIQLIYMLQSWVVFESIKMAQVVENSASGTKSSAEKRKLEANSDDELFFAYESNSKLQKSEPTKPEEV